MTTPDEEMQPFFDKGAKYLSILGHERIMTIYGRIHSANDLISTDLFGKSDPYVIVEALTTSGTLEFVYRTRVIPDSLCPKWNEAFFFKVPPDPENPKVPIQMQKLQFTVFDSDEGEAFDADGADDPLGAATVDIAFMRHGDSIEEEYPLLGIKTRPGGYRNNGGFR